MAFSAATAHRCGHVDDNGHQTKILFYEIHFMFLQQTSSNNNLYF